MHPRESLMRCSWVQDRLVAFADGELSPGEATFVAEHLCTCDDCAEMDVRLREYTPEPALEVPDEILAELARVVDDAVAAELERPTPRVAPTYASRWSRWLRRDRDLSNGAMVGYGILLAACMGWGLSNWVAVQELRAEVERAPIAVTAPSNTSTIDPDQYVPASYSPDDPEENWR